MFKKIIKFNLKSFVNEYIVATESGDDETLEELEGKFEHFCETVNNKIKQQSVNYILNNSLIKSSDKCVKYFEKF